MITAFIVPARHGIDVNDIRFQQDGSTCHTSHVAIDLCKTFYARLRRKDGVNWLSRSCDLTPFDYLLQGTVKEKCYAEKPDVIEYLKPNIRDVIVDIRLYALEKVHENWSDRIRYCQTSRGSHMNEIIFHCSNFSHSHFSQKKKMVTCKRSQKSVFGN